jgi:hypothetical protein
MTISIFPKPKTLKTYRQSMSLIGRRFIRLYEPHSENFSAALERFAHPIRGSATYGTTYPDQTLLHIHLKAGFPSEAYQIRSKDAGFELFASDECGLFRGLSSLRQILGQADKLGELPYLLIEDKPDLPNRGVMLDISRCKVPTMNTLKALIEQFAQAKFNQLQLYTEHTFAFTSHETVWANASPLTAAETLELKHFAAARYIELVPNLNCFGHFERWLRHPNYHQFAECPDGFVHPLSGAAIPHGSTLYPSRRSTKLIQELHDEYLPLFDSPYVNVGGDEPWELGLGRSKKKCEAAGTTNVYIDFISDIQRLVEKKGRQMMFWSDIVLKEPSSLKRLSKQLIALNWGYEGNHPFKREAELVAAQRIPFYVCPGTSSWNSLIGRTENMRRNIQNAAKHGLNNDAEGLLVTDWGDHGHHQYLPISYPGFAVAASESWRVGSTREGNLNQLVHRLFLPDESEATVNHLLELGRALELVKSPIRNATIFNRLLFWGMEHEPSLTKKLEAKQLQGAVDRLETLQRALRPADALLAAELDNAINMAKHGAQRLLYFRASKTSKEDLSALRGQMRHIQGQHEALWLARNRPGGLNESLEHLERAESALELR